jgi:hypothetical protein
MTVQYFKEVVHTSVSVSIICSCSRNLDGPGSDSHGGLKIFSPSVHTCPGAHPASWTVGNVAGVGC